MKHVLAWLAMAGALMAADSTFRIAGVVVDAVSGKAMPKVRVALLREDSSGVELASVRTPADGRFEFTVPAGKYQLRAGRNDVLTQTYGLGSLSSGFGIAIVAGPGQKTERLVFRMHRSASITGKVNDEAGEPVADALVQLIRAGVVLGRARTMPVGYARTDDRGVYRFGNLGPGRYYLVVTARPWHELEHTGYAPTYFPNTTDPRSAAPLVLKEGEEGVASFALTSTACSRVSVQVSDMKVPTQLRFVLMSEGAQGVPRFQETMDGPGLASMTGVPQGRYDLLVAGGAGFDEPRAFEKVEVGTSDVELTVQLQDPPKVGGTVSVPGQDPALLHRMAVMLYDDDNSRGDARAVDALGAFRFPSVVPGRYRLRIAAPKGDFASDVQVEGGTVKDGRFDVMPGVPVNLKVTAGFGNSRLRGLVQRGGEPVAGVIVVLAPEWDANAVDAYLSFQTDSDGSFDLEDLRAGTYHLFAVEDLDFEWANPEAVKPHREGAKVVNVKAGATMDERIDLP